MTVVADITVPATAFALGRVFDDVPEVVIELERLIPVQESIIPLFWVSGGEIDAVKTTLHDHPQTEAIEELTTAGNATLFEVHWGPEINGLIGALIDHGGKILEASGTADSWDFRLRFISHEELSAFNVALTEADIPVTLRRIYNLPPATAEPSLETTQHETLLRAYHRGYFNVPRRTTLSELAETEGVSDSALSQRIRRGMSSLIEQTLVVDEYPGGR